MRVYSRIRNMLVTHKELLVKFDQLENQVDDHDKKIMLIFEHLKQLEQTRQQELEQANRKRIGLKTGRE